MLRVRPCGLSTDQGSAPVASSCVESAKPRVCPWRCSFNENRRSSCRRRLSAKPPAMNDDTDLGRGMICLSLAVGFEKDGSANLTQPE
jgi:hypothetical protein